MLQLAVEQELTLTEEQYQQISEIVYNHCGINLHDGKKELIRSRLAKLLRKNQMSSYAEYLDRVMKDTEGPAFSEFINSLTTNLTMFFREPHHFEFLGTSFMPRLLDDKDRNRYSRIRAWSAGCSSGEEPYSIAMLLHNVVSDFHKWDVKILASDISSSILEKAQRGVYHRDKTSNIPQPLKVKYTQSNPKDHSQVMIVNQIKDMIVFKYLNLIRDWPFRGPFDFIFCRNVMIYFDRQTQQQLINKFWDVLAPGGTLFTGHSESLTGINHRFKYLLPTIYQKP